MSQDTVVALIGSGAIEGTWQPVLRALRESEVFPGVKTAEGANFAMALLIYRRRQVESHALDPRYQPLMPPDALQILKDGVQPMRDRLYNVKRKIADALKQADGQLKVRDEFGDVVRHFVLRGAAKVAVITTNWDKIVDREARTIDPRLRVYHLHGDVDASEGLLLPSEIVEEPYRTKEEVAALARARKIVMNTINTAQRLVVYGLSLSPLDAELGQVLASGLINSTVKRIDVIDPDYSAVCERVSALVDLTETRGPRVNGFTPKDRSLWLP